MSQFTDEIFKSVIGNVELLEQHRDALSKRADTLDGTVSGLQAQLAINTPSVDSKRLKLITEALRLMEKRVPYVFGGESDSGMDCSGFIQTLFKGVGVLLPRVSADQFRTGVAVVDGQEQFGDILGFDINTRNGAGIEHIGMCIGNGLMIHTAKPGEGINIANYRARYGTMYVGARRVI